MRLKGFSKSAPDRHLRFLIGAHAVWLVFVLLLGVWWGRLVFEQASRIAQLENALGMSEVATRSHWDKTLRMLLWEGGTFFLLFLLSTGVLYWVYWRDVKRARGIQAFFASVTHELRTPLTSIRLQAESIAESFDTQELPQKVLLQRLLEDTLRLETQVERTLELARVEGGGPVYTQPLQIKSWVDRFTKTWVASQGGGQGNGKVHLKADVEDLWVDADPIAMHVIFKNLLENSLKHSGREDVTVTIKASGDVRKVYLWLEDDGVGYQGTNGSHQKLGALFHKGADSPGAGVGLYLVKSLMKRMGGSAEFLNADPGFKVLLGFRSGGQT